MKKILIFQLKNVCYDSYTYFSNRIGAGLSQAGYEVTYFQIGRDGTLADIEQFEQQDFDAILEFNSDLPKILCEDGSHFLNHLDAPFIDFILDHPLYHHDMLRQPIDQLHVCCLDWNHKTYIEEHYPHIKSVFVLPMTGEEADTQIPFLNRDIPLLFSGTYTCTSEVWEAINDCPSFIGQDIRWLIEQMQADSSLTLEAAVSLLAQHSDSLIMESFPLHMQAYFLADTYLRASLREQVITTLLTQHYPLTIYGGDWDKLPCPDQRTLSLHKGIAYEQSFTLMQHARITLNVMPLFKNGCHDRILSSMLNGSVSLTDRSLFLTEHFTDRKDLVFYDIQSTDSLLSAVDLLFHDSSLAAEIAQNGYHTAAMHYSWSNQIAQLLPVLASICGDC